MKDKLEYYISNIVKVNRRNDETGKDEKVFLFIGDDGEKALDVDIHLLEEYYNKLKTQEEIAKNLLFQRHRIDK